MENEEKMEISLPSQTELNSATEGLMNMDDVDLEGFRFTWSSRSRYDDDPVSIPSIGEYGTYDGTFRAIQEECRKKSLNSAHVNSSTDDYIGRLTGYGFDYYSEIPELKQFMDSIWTDPRNRLYSFMPKFVGRSYQEGELFLILTVHTDGFVEIDFAEPSNLAGGSDGSGIVSHPYKQSMPLFYIFNRKNTDYNLSADINVSSTEIIPSIYAAYYPELKKYIEGSAYYIEENIKDSLATTNSVLARNTGKFKNLNGYRRFVVSWDKSLMTKRNLSHLRTVITWINLYEMLKRYEIEHKKSSGAFVWAIEVTDPKMFRKWLSLSDEEKAATGIMSKKEPGGTLILPPGMKLIAVNPTLPKISNEDTDILQHIAGGINVTSNILTGSYGGTTYGAIKEGGKTQTDRTKDKIVEFERFLKYDFWRAIFWLSSQVSSFAYEYKVKAPVGFTKEGKVKTKFIKKKAEECIKLTFPSTAFESLESKARGLLGSKSGSLDNMLGVPKARLAEEMGFVNYDELRLEKAYEDERYPDLIGAVDPEQLVKQSTESSSDSNNDNNSNKK